MTGFLYELFRDEELDEDEPTLHKLGYCALFCGLGIVLGELIFTFALGAFLAAFGLKNGSEIGATVGACLLFATLTLIYIYHVGLIAEAKQRAQYQAHQEEQTLHPLPSIIESSSTNKT